MCNFLAMIAVFSLICSAAAQVKPEVLSPGLSRVSGVEETSHIEYVRLFLAGTLLPETANGSSVPLSDLPPTLTAQCTRRANGKLVFELLANFGGVADLAYYPPWRRVEGGDLFPPRLDKPMITMEFLGYTHVKPVRRQWEALQQPAGQYRYNPPSSGSSNLEDSTYYLRYLIALPRLRLTLAGRSAWFDTTPLLGQIRKEPLCKASLL